MAAKRGALPALLRAIGDPLASLLEPPGYIPPPGANNSLPASSVTSPRLTGQRQGVAFTFPKETSVVLHRYHGHGNPPPVVLEKLVPSQPPTAAKISHSKGLSKSHCAGVPVNRINVDLSALMQQPPIGCDARQQRPCASGAHAVLGEYHQPVGQIRQQPLVRQQWSRPPRHVNRSEAPMLFTPDEFSDLVYDVLQKKDLYPTSMDVVEESMMNRLRLEAIWNNARRNAMPQAYPGRILPDGYAAEEEGYDDEDVESDSLGGSEFVDIEPNEILF